MKRPYLILGSLCTALIIASVSLFTISIINDSTPTEQIASTYDGFDYSWVDLDPYIAHAGGGILGHTYTNSYEALLLNYQLGHRLFEFDFSLSSDDDVILVHDSAKTNSYAFNSTLVQDKFHALPLEQLIDFLLSHPDVYIITDTKYTDEASTRTLLERLCTATNAYDRAILDHFIIQIYLPEMLDWVMDVYPWKSIIYTLYANPEWTPENVVEFAKESGVKYITLFYTAANDKVLDLWKSADLLVGVHTINDLSTAKEAFSRGATNVYTDYLLP